MKSDEKSSQEFNCTIYHVNVHRVLNADCIINCWKEEDEKTLGENYYQPGSNYYQNE